jgi:hypothetical protein
MGLGRHGRTEVSGWVRSSVRWSYVVVRGVHFGQLEDIAVYKGTMRGIIEDV